MSKEDAVFGLKSKDLRIRFPYGHHIFRAPTTLAGVGIAQGRNSIRLTVPPYLENDDFRRAYRVDKVGRANCMSDFTTSRPRRQALPMV